MHCKSDEWWFFAQSKLNESGKTGRGLPGRLAAQPSEQEEQEGLVLGETGVRQPIGKLVKAAGNFLGPFLNPQWLGVQAVPRE